MIAAAYPSIARAGYIVEMDEPPLIDTYSEYFEDIRSAEKEIHSREARGLSASHAQLQQIKVAARSAVANQAANVERSQADFVSRLNAHGLGGLARSNAGASGSTMPRRLRNLLNAVYLDAPDDEVEAISHLPGVRGVYLATKMKRADGGPATETFTSDPRTVLARQLYSGRQRLTGVGVSIAVLDGGFRFGLPQLGGCLESEIANGSCRKIPRSMDVYNSFDIDGDGMLDGCFEVRPNYANCTPNAPNCYCEGYCPNFASSCQTGGINFFFRNPNGGLLGDACYSKVNASICSSQPTNHVRELHPTFEQPASNSPSHGTLVAAIAGGIGSTGPYIDAPDTGVAPGSDLYLYKVEGTQFSIAPEIYIQYPELYEKTFLDYAEFGDLFDLLAGLDGVVDPRGDGSFEWMPDVINISEIPGKGLPPEIIYPFDGDILNSAVTRAVANGIVVVAAAGNQGPEAFVEETPCRVYPSNGSQLSICGAGAAKSAITVGATSNDVVTNYSSRGPACATVDCYSTNLKPDLVAVGNSPSIVPGDPPGQRQGTSYAAPQVAGAAALLIQSDWSLHRNPLAVKQRLMDNAHELGAEFPYEAQGKGKLDVLAAVANSVTVVVDGERPGTVYSTSSEQQDGQIECDSGELPPTDSYGEPPNDCLQWFLDGEVVTLHAEPSEGSAVIWHARSGVECSTTGSSSECILSKLTDDTEMEAEFASCDSIDPFESVAAARAWEQCGPDIAASARVPENRTGAGQVVHVPYSVLSTPDPSRNSPSEFSVQLAIYGRNKQTGAMEEKYAERRDGELGGTAIEGTIDWTPTEGGVYVLSVFGDSTKEIAEDNEENNSISSIITVDDPPTVSIDIVVDGAQSGNSVVGVVSGATVIDCPRVNCHATVPEQAVVLLTAISSQYGKFGGWTKTNPANPTGCGGTSSSSCAFTAIYGEKLRAAFESKQLTVSVTPVNLGGAGTVTSSPAGIRCNEADVSCQQRFAAGQSVTLTATPAASNQFAGWTGISCATSTCSAIVMNSDKTVTAKFQKSVTHGLVVGVSTHYGKAADDYEAKLVSSPGTVKTVPSTGVVERKCTSTTCAPWSYQSDKTVTLIAQANPGATFEYWSGACSGSGTCQVPMTADREVRGHFRIAERQFNIKLDLYEVQPNRTTVFTLDSWGFYLHKTIRCVDKSSFGEKTCGRSREANAGTPADSSWLDSELASYSGDAVGLKVGQVFASTTGTSWPNYLGYGPRWLHLRRDISPIYLLVEFSSDWGRSVVSRRTIGSASSDAGSVDVEISGPAADFSNSANWLSGEMPPALPPPVSISVPRQNDSEEPDGHYGLAYIDVRSVAYAPIGVRPQQAPDIAAYVYNVGELTANNVGLTLKVYKDGNSQPIATLPPSTLASLPHNRGAVVIWEHPYVYDGLSALKFEVCSPNACNSVPLFKPTLELSITGGGRGTITTSPKPNGSTIVCRGRNESCPVPSQFGDAFRLSATSVVGSSFKEWSGDDVDQCHFNDNGDCTVYVGGPRDIRATFIDTRTPIPRFGQRVTASGAKPVGRPMSATIPNQGEIVAWRGQSGGSEQIRYRELSSWTAHSLNEELGIDYASLEDPKFAALNTMALSPGGRIVWSDALARRYHHYQFVTKSRGDLSPEYPRLDLAVSDTNLVYSDNGESNTDVFLRSTQDSSEATLLTVPPPSSELSRRKQPNTSGSRMIWLEKKNSTPNFELYLHDIGSSSSHVLRSNSDHISDPVVSGDHVVWTESTDGGDVLLGSLNTEGSLVASKYLGGVRNASQSAPWVSSEAAVWVDESSGTPKLLVYDLVGGHTYRLTTSEDAEFDPHISGRRVTWRGHDNDGLDYVATYLIPQQWAELESGFYGDVNNDGQIAAIDALMALQISIGDLEPTTTEEFKPAAADLDGQAGVKASDALIILQIAVGQRTLPPPTQTRAASSSDIALPIPDHAAFFSSRIEVEIVGGGRLATSSPDASIAYILNASTASSLGMDLPSAADMTFTAAAGSPGHLLGWIVSGGTTISGCGLSSTCRVATGTSARVVAVFDGDPCIHIACSGVNCSITDSCPRCPAQLGDAVCQELTAANLDFSKNLELPHKNRLSFSASVGEATARAELGNPVAGNTNYALCLYQGTSLVWETALKAQALCLSGQPCWTDNATQVQYRNTARDPAQGIRSMQLRARETGVRAQVSGRGTGLSVPDLLALGSSDEVVTFQIVRTSGLPGDSRCWESYLQHPERFDARRYSAESAD